MTVLTNALLAFAVLLQSTPDDPRRPGLEQCYRDIRIACGVAEDGGQCLATGRQACEMMLGDPEQTRSRNGANLRHRIHGI